MTKGEVIKAVKEKALEAGVNISKDGVNVITSALFETIVEAVNREGKVKFGEVTYYIKDIKARDGVSRLQGESKPWHTDAHREISVKPSKSLKAMAE